MNINLLLPSSPMSVDDARRFLTGAAEYPDGWDADAMKSALQSFNGAKLISRISCKNWRDCGRSPRWAVWLVEITANGKEIAHLKCLRCGQLQRTIGARKLGIDASSAPLYRDNRNDDACERCGSTDGVELHHWAPWYLFADAHQWPTSYLCPPCHQYWHRIVTPNMGRKTA